MQKRLLLISLLSVLSAAATLLSACHPALGKFDALVNQGLLPLSIENPYNGSNLFLATEAQTSLVLESFLMNRGVPLAIQLSRGTVGPTEMAMFYPEVDEYFVATLTEVRSVRDWVIRGPFQTDRRAYRELRNLVSTPYGKPMLLLDGEELTFPGVAALQPTPLPTPSPTPIKKTLIAKVPHKPASTPTPAGPSPTATPVPVVDPLIGKRISEDLLAIIKAEGWAERTLQGDVLHSVRSGDTLDRITAWFTGSDGNSALIRTKNGLPPSGEPTIGQKILIPRELAVQFKPLP